MKTAIFYKSFLGSTKKYANWLAQELKADIYSFSKAKNDNFSNYDSIIVASGTYAGKMPLTDFLKKNWNFIKNKKVVAISVGISPPGEIYTKETFDKIPEEIRNSIKIIRLPGSMFGFTVLETGKVKKENIEQVISLLK